MVCACLLESSSLIVCVFSAQVLEACRGVVLEMTEAGGAGDRGRLQEALKGAVMWLSQNGSNPDVASSSAQVLSQSFLGWHLLLDLIPLCCLFISFP